MAERKHAAKLEFLPNASKKKQAGHTAESTFRRPPLYGVLKDNEANTGLMDLVYHTGKNEFKDEVADVTDLVYHTDNDLLDH